MDYIVQGLKGNFGCFEGKQKGDITPKPERLHPPKLVCMHFTSSSTCINFLNRFYFLTPMDYSPLFERGIWPFLRIAVSLKSERPHPPKLVYMHVTSMPTCMNFLSRMTLCNDSPIQCTSPEQLLSIPSHLSLACAQLNDREKQSPSNLD